MTDTLIALISILAGIFGANLSGLIFKKYSFGIVGNTIAGVFGSIFFIKSFGRLGFDPVSIMKLGEVNLIVFLINMLISFFGGISAVFLIFQLKNKMNNSAKKKSVNN